jgi:hypothetical protein
MQARQTKLIRADPLFSLLKTAFRCLTRGVHFTLQEYEKLYESLVEVVPVGNWQLK